MSLKMSGLNKVLITIRSSWVYNNSLTSPADEKISSQFLVTVFNDPCIIGVLPGGIRGYR